MHLDYVQATFTDQKLVVSDGMLDGPQYLAPMVRKDHSFTVKNTVNAVTAVTSSNSNSNSNSKSVVSVSAADVQEKLSFWLNKMGGAGKFQRLYELEVLRGVPKDPNLDDDYVHLDVMHFR